MGHTTQLRGMASTLGMRTALSPEQWQPWMSSAVSALLGLISMAQPGGEQDSKVTAYHLPFTAEAYASIPLSDSSTQSMW